MGALGIVLMVIVAVAVVLVVVVVVARIVVGRVRKAAEATMSENFAPGEAVRSDPMANYFGLASKDGMQMRGNGALVLTDTRLWFVRAGSDAPLDIPLSSVTAVEIVRSHAGKRVGRDLLSVSFAGDSAAWHVGGSETWRDQILARIPDVP